MLRHERPAQHDSSGDEVSLSVWGFGSGVHDLGFGAYGSWFRV